MRYRAWSETLASYIQSDKLVVKPNGEVWVGIVRVEATIELWTGKTTKGVDIYEGDILRAKGSLYELTVKKSDNGKWIGLPGVDEGSFKVVGNIHEF